MRTSTLLKPNKRTFEKRLTLFFFSDKAFDNSSSLSVEDSWKKLASTGYFSFHEKLPFLQNIICGV
ncbi:hypothetical protein, partial [Flavobacterium sp. XS2P39]|uniref:hypothetical protein n=1 Tax=Flavobacterium sp. XS2P39 TaxID=3401725 RepID=UPI003AAC2F3C